MERELPGVGVIGLPAALKPVAGGAVWDDDPSRLYFRFDHPYGWLKSLGSGPAYRQVLNVSLMAPDAKAADDDHGSRAFPSRTENWSEYPDRFTLEAARERGTQSEGGRRLVDDVLDGRVQSLRELLGREYR